MEMQIANILECSFTAPFCALRGDIFGLMEKFFKISIFNILTGQKRDMTELNLVWPVNTTGQRSEIILSPGLIEWYFTPLLFFCLSF